MVATDNDLIQRSDEDQKRAVEIFDNFRDELNKRQLSNTENYDKAILTLSSSGLAISLTFIRSIVPIDSAEYLFLVQLGWGLFLLSIIMSLVAYQLSNKAIDKEMQKAEEYYINSRQSAFAEKNWFSNINNILNIIIGLLFVVATSCIILFAILNLRQDTSMSDKDTQQTSNKIFVTDSAIMPRMQAAPSDLQTNSATMPRMQAAPSSQAQSQTQQPQSSASSSQTQSE
ncbi:MULTISPECIES: hypothetical protein [Vibrio]|uniref:Uncharacterized protein n=1 Tax=Vibrio tasmaniensis TaxID=212663 RepID=A0A0H3ZQI0_9VIBR|nr:hypothetical protein [Vibrio tasmaniensis]AKN38129.1 hypothetical protein [Vibrio tasmaniensis]AKN38320.1 hypothetical protein [Vibrio tasmaniensis]